MDKPIYFIGEKIYDPTIKENLTTKINQIKNKIDINNEDYKILLKEINNYNKPKLLTYGNNSLLNILKSPKEGKKLLFENTYGILANLLYKYKDNLDINIYEYIHLVDKQTIINKIKLGNSNYFLQILSQDEIDIDILKEMIYNEPELLAKININPNNKILTEVLKQRYQLYFQNEEYYFNLKNTKEFYKHLINNKIFNIKEYSLSNVIDIIIKSNKKEYNIYLKCSLIAPLFKYIKNN